MLNKKLLIFLSFIVIVFGLLIYQARLQPKVVPASNPPEPIQVNPLQISQMRARSYQGSDLIIEETLAPGENYKQYIVSYKSDGLKIYGLLTVPTGVIPKSGWPVIIFNHGYIPPTQYKTTERYVAYVDGFAREGFVVFKPDYRGNGNSEGMSEGAYYSPAYTIDVLNALASVKRYKDVDPEKIGMWGHSMGGNITLRVMVISSDIKAGVIWAGVVGTYDELLNKWHGIKPTTFSNQEIAGHISSIRQNLILKYGTPSSNPSFWQSIDPRFFLKDISGPLQLHQGLADAEVPFLFSEGLKNDLEKQGKPVEFYTYNGADHNISGPSFNLAMQRSIEFFNKYLK
ncbi:MAG: alpha/beta fold hydrolase [Candidatus Daviesbacteria bacterium]|nr:alpha/beta fold hydrolase [Candidatus Daviesbacteria bacterium]